MKDARNIILLLISTFAVVSGIRAQCGPVISAFPYSEGFESSAAWTTGVVSGTNDWAWGAPAHPSINSAGGGTKEYPGTDI